MIYEMTLLWVLFFVFIQLCIAVSNHFIIPPLPETIQLQDPPFVSILVPARNEEKNIASCIQSLLEQEYENYEILVLDDGSEDKTGSILQGLAANNDTLRVLQGKPLQEGWYGKHWACHQLAEKARGQWILFTDADTVHKSTMLSSAIRAGEADKADLLTAFVQEEMISIGERLTVPFPVWSIFALLPVIIGYLFKLPAFSAVNGQFMLFRKSSYRSIGGHGAIRDHAVDDVALGRLIVKTQLKWRIYDATKHVSCRMYTSFEEALQGFSKNYFALFEYRILLSSFIWTWMAFVSLYPLFFILCNAVLINLNAFWTWIAVLIVLVQSGIWTLTARRFVLPLSTVLFHPVIVVLASYIGLVSMQKTIRGKAAWKGRSLKGNRVRWL